MPLFHTSLYQVHQMIYLAFLQYLEFEFPCWEKGPWSPPDFLQFSPRRFFLKVFFFSSLPGTFQSILICLFFFYSINEVVSDAFSSSILLQDKNTNFIKIRNNPRYQIITKGT